MSSWSIPGMLHAPHLILTDSVSLIPGEEDALRKSPPCSQNKNVSWNNLTHTSVQQTLNQLNFFTLYFIIYHYRRLHNEELYDLYSSPNIIQVIKSRRMRWSGHVARMGERNGAYRISVGRLKGRRPLGRPGCRWEDNIKTDLQEMGGGHGLDCSGSG
jgi:hypothetical protein